MGAAPGAGSLPGRLVDSTCYEPQVDMEQRSDERICSFPRNDFTWTGPGRDRAVSDETIARSQHGRTSFVTLAHDLTNFISSSQKSAGREMKGLETFIRCGL